MKASKEQMMEAIRRLSILKVIKDVKDHFEEGGLHYSENGILFFLEQQPDWLKMVREYEKEYSCLVYHVVHSYTSFGELLTLLSVSGGFAGDWDDDKDWLKKGYTYAYVINLDYPDCSEGGGVTLRPVFGGVVRTA